MKNFFAMSDQAIIDYLLSLQKQIATYNLKIGALNDDTKENRHNRCMFYRNRNWLERIVFRGNAELTKRQRGTNAELTKRQRGTNAELTKRQHEAWLDSFPQYASFKQCPANLKSMIQWRKVNRKVKWDTERPKPVAIVHHAGNRIELFEENQTERF